MPGYRGVSVWLLLESIERNRISLIISKNSIPKSHHVCMNHCLSGISVYKAFPYVEPSFYLLTNELVFGFSDVACRFRIDEDVVEGRSQGFLEEREDFSELSANVNYPSYVALLRLLPNSR